MKKRLMIVDEEKFKERIGILILAPFMVVLGFLLAILFSKGYFTVIY